MSPRRITIAELASSAGMDVDEALILLWDSRLDQYDDPSDLIRAGDLNAAKRALGVATRRELTSPDHWKSLLQMTGEEFQALLEGMDIRLSPRSRRLPKGAIAKLRRAVTSQTRPVGSGGLIPKTVNEQHQAGPSQDSPPPEEEEFEWRQVGRPREVRLLTREEVEGIHFELVNDFATDPDPIDPPGVRDPQLLESAVFRQHTSLAGELKYPTVEMAGGALLHSIVHDHPFFNGNKRTALVSMIVLMDENGAMLTSTEGELFRFVLKLAQHQIVPNGKNLADREVLWIADWLRQNSRSLEKGDRPIPWRRLRQILTSFDCRLEKTHGRRNRMNITRKVQERRRFGPPRRRELATQVKYTDEGRDATVHAIKRIRRELRLDEENGCDSIAFYRESGLFPSEFIVKYRKTLKRLARL